jgi:acyl-CoA thioesterase FadM
MTYECAAYRLPDDELMVIAELTLVLVDLQRRRPVPIPEEIRASVRAFEGADLQE